MLFLSELLANEQNFVDYVKDRMIFFIIIAVCLVAVIVICSILIGSHSKAKKAQTPAENGDETEIAAAGEEPAPTEPQAIETAKAETQPQEETNAVKEEKNETEEKTQNVATTNEPTAKAESAATVSAPVKNEKNVKATAAKKKKTDDASSAYIGKWIVSMVSVTDKDGSEVDYAYYFQLKASNGETLISSEDYTSLRGAIQGIETFKTNIAKSNFKVSVTKKGKYIVKLMTSQGMLLAQGEKYATRAQAMSAISSIKRFAASAVRSEDVQTIKVPYEPINEAPEKNYDPDKKGKWVIKKAIADGEKEEAYYFELHASNGQTLFSSEEYSTLAGLKNGIKTHKTNIEKGNIRAVVTRNGDYIFKIFNGNGQLLCLGEHYKNKQLCLNAIESVKRFAKNAELGVESFIEEE